MTMTFRYINVTGSHTFNVDLGTAAVRLGSISGGLVTMAELGQSGSGAIDIDDPGGLLDILGLQWFKVTESAVAGSNTVWCGYIGDRTITRGDSLRGSLRTGRDRLWSLALEDFNSILTMRMIQSGNRPAETAAARLTWLLALAYCPVHNYGYVTFPTHAMDAVDYTDQTFTDVLADIVAPVSFNYWADWDDAHSGIGLWLLDPAGSAYASAAAISNVLADIGAGVYGPIEGTTSLKRSASRVASGVALHYTGGRVYVTNSGTADKYTNFDHAAPMANVKTAAKATVVANAFLAQSAGEDDRITTSIKVPKANVNDIKAGHLIPARFSHLPGYATPARACRVMSRAVLQDEETAERYKMTLELVPVVQPRPGSGLPGWIGDTPPNYPACTTLGVTVLPDGIYPPLLALAPTSRPDGLLVYWRSGCPAPGPSAATPTPSYGGDWHFGVYNSGGVDYASFPYGNELYIYTTGPGTITLHTAPTTGGGSTTLSAALLGWSSGWTTTIASISGVAPGADITFTVPDDGACYHIVHVQDAGAGPGGSWGFAGYHWANA